MATKKSHLAGSILPFFFDNYQMRRSKKSLLVSAFLLLFALKGFSQIDERSLERNLNFFQNVIESEYAPALWKKAHFGWDLDFEIQKIRTQIAAHPKMTLKEYQKQLIGLFASMRDYHTSIDFYSTESATLPFQIKEVKNRYFFVYIDRKKLSEASFPFSEGDELVTFGGKPVSEVIDAIAGSLGGNTEQTDRALAGYYLTARFAARGQEVPSGPITIGVRKGGSPQILNRQLIWEYTPEQIKAPDIASKTKSTLIKSSSLVRERKSNLLDLKMQTPHFQYLAEHSSSPFGLGHRKSYIPALGPKIWESGPNDLFDAYIYQTKDRHAIGYIRIAHYSPQSESAAVSEFGKLVTRMQTFTDALVIDQINNPGGSVFYLYALLGMLSDQALSTPLHRMTITQESVSDALSLMTRLSPSRVTTEDSAQNALLGLLDGYPMSLQVARYFYEYARFIQNEWSVQGHMLTDPYYLEGVSDINPSPVARYTKPILVVINELDFSGGDFFPTILQDNKRAIIFGTRTAGAGGYVMQHQFPNSFGISSFSLTGSIAERVDKNPIENLGVKPDVVYELTEDDVRKGFEGYRDAIKEQIQSMIQ